MTNPAVFYSFAVFPDLFSKGLSLNAQKIIYFFAAAKNSEFCTLKNVVRFLGLAERTAKREFADLQNKFFIAKAGTTKGAFYILNTTLLPTILSHAIKAKAARGGNFFITADNNYLKYLYLNTNICTALGISELQFLFCELVFYAGRLGWVLDKEKPFYSLTIEQIADALGISERTAKTLNKDFKDKHGFNYLNDRQNIKGYEFCEFWTLTTNKKSAKDYLAIIDFNNTKDSDYL